MNPFVLSRARTLQWLTALVAVCYHVRFLMFVDYTHVANKSLLLRAFYFFTSLGHEAFIVYMAVAGLLFGTGAWPRWRAGGAAPLDGLAARLRALYWWVVPALLVGGLLDVAGSRWFAGTGVYALVPQYHPAHLSLRTLAGNLLLLQDVAVQGYGSNAMLFLLTYEWWACAVAAIFALAGQGRPWPGLVGAGAVGLTMSWLAPEFFGYWFAWLAGLAAALYGQRLRGHLGTWAGAALFAAALAGSRLVGARLAQVPPQLVPEARLALDIVVALGVGAYFLALQSAPARASSAAAQRELARLSLPLFAIHFPLMLFLVAAAAQLLGLSLRAQPHMGGACGYALIVGAIYLFAQRFAWLVACARALLARPARASPVARRETSAAAKVK
ncbi:MAG: hypothetical protein ACXWC4_00365 [Telluria sp.]